MDPPRDTPGFSPDAAIQWAAQLERDTSVRRALLLQWANTIRPTDPQGAAALVAWAASLNDEASAVSVIANQVSQNARRLEEMERREMARDALLANVEELWPFSTALLQLTRTLILVLVERRPGGD